MPYHSEGIGKNKKIKEQRKKPIPLELMMWKTNIPPLKINKYVSITKELNEPKRP